MFLYLAQTAEGQCRGSLVDDSHYMAVASGDTNKLTELLSESVKNDLFRETCFLFENLFTTL